MKKQISIYSILLGFLFITSAVIISSCKNDEKTFYKVSFDTQGGSNISPIVLDGQKTIAKPTPDPTRDGYTFGGWFSNADATTAFDFSVPIKESITIYAKWNIVDVDTQKFKVTFETGEGFPKVDTQNVDKDKKATEPTPTRAGYEVEGWYTDKDKTKAFDFDNPITEDAILYAKWDIVDTQKFTVTFNANQGKDGPKAQVIEKDAKATLPSAKDNPTREGFIFAGWYKEADTKTLFDFANTPITSNITVYAKWNIVDVDTKTFTVTFSANQGKGGPKVQVIEEDAKAILPSAKDSPTREGFIFVGWYKEADTKILFDFANTPITSNITVYAKWSNNESTIKVSFETGEGFPKVDAQDVEKNTKVAKPTPTREGYEVEGWYTDKGKTKAFDFDTPITENITLYAKWLRQFTVTFNLNGGDGTKPANQTVKSGDKATKPADPTRSGYVFNGWFVSDSTTAAFDFNTPITENTALTAKWIQAFTVTFNLNGGDGTKPANQTVKSGDKATKPADPTRSGYVFNGWFVSDSATSAFDFNTPITENTVLTARWEKKSYTVTFNLNGGNSAKPANQTILYQDKSTKPADPTRTGYEFEGWFVSDSATTAFDFDTPITENTALTAKWIQAFTVTFDTKGGSTIAAASVADGKKVAQPNPSPTKDGNNLYGWYTDDIINDAFDFDTPITKNLTLYARYRLKPANKQELENIINPLISANSRVNLNHIDTSLITEMAELFKDSSFNGNISEWNVSNVTSMNAMFQGSSFNGNISEWNVSNVTSMNAMFRGVFNFNQDISNWSVSNVTIMTSMFSGAANFNQDINNWNVSNVTSMDAMFSGATNFNQDISNWNVSNVTNISGMFAQASNFNQNVSSWNVGNVTDMSFMFLRASNFNQDISNWNVGNVTDMSNIFDRASRFDQNLSGWNVAKVTSKSDAFKGTPMENDANKKPAGF